MDQATPMQTTSVETIVVVSGMSCDHCVRAVEAEVSAVPGVEHVVVDLASGRVAVRSTGPLDDAAIAEAVAEAGYEVAS
jgi:copper chaperone